VSLDLAALAAAVAAHGPLARILIVATAGSVPREAGTSMLVWAEGQDGTIGGGALEVTAVERARALLAGGPARVRAAVPLGPRLGQCCGGSVTLLWERFGPDTLPQSLPYARFVDAPRGTPPVPPPGSPPVERDGWIVESGPAPRRSLWIWGAGHVGRALVSVLAPLPDRAITWVDLAPDLFPEAAPPGVTAVPAADPTTLVPFALQDADHLVLTRSHAVDLALCDALLRHGFASLGLIGSATKRARFRSRLAALGHSPAQISRIACPIGDPALGKHPQAIAVGVACALIRQAASGTGATGDGTGCPTR
jgi:xanthine dehydrogenase accessory factor